MGTSYISTSWEGDINGWDSSKIGHIMKTTMIFYKRNCRPKYFMLSSQTSRVSLYIFSRSIWFSIICTLLLQRPKSSKSKGKKESHCYSFLCAFLILCHHQLWVSMPTSYPRLISGWIFFYSQLVRDWRQYTLKLNFASFNLG